MKQIQVKIDRLRELYYTIKETRAGDEDAVQNDITETFWENLHEKIQERILINIAVRGEVAEGKSNNNTRRNRNRPKKPNNQMPSKLQKHNRRRIPTSN